MRSLLAVWVVATALAGPAGAVVSSDGSVAYRNTTTSGLSTGEITAWDLLGELNGFYVTPVSARHVLAAKHVGGSVGATVSFAAGPNQGTYTTLGFVDEPSSDLRLWEISGPLAAWLPIYTSRDERDSTVTIFGRGGPAGPDVSVDPAGAIGPTPAHFKGFAWGPNDSQGSWGRNIIDRNSFVPGFGSVLVADFDRAIFGGIAEECHISNGDSSGPWLIEEGGVWKLAGMSSVVSGPFQQDDGGAPDGQFFEAMLFDKGGLWEGDPAFYQVDQFSDSPSSAFAVRISSYDDWLLPQLDSDGDAIPDDADNCTLIGNPSQSDADGDGYGDACDCDFDQSNDCDAEDFDVFLPDFVSGLDSGFGTDMNENGEVDAIDFVLWLPGFDAGQPGPSGIAP